MIQYKYLYYLFTNAAINVLPQRGKGGHTRDIDIKASPVTGAAELLLTQGSPRVGAFLAFSAEKDWEEV